MFWSSIFAPKVRLPWLLSMGSVPMGAIKLAQPVSASITMAKRDCLSVTEKGTLSLHQKVVDRYSRTGREESPSGLPEYARWNPKEHEFPHRYWHKVGPFYPRLCP